MDYRKKHEQQQCPSLRAMKKYTENIERPKAHNIHTKYVLSIVGAHKGLKYMNKVSRDYNENDSEW